MTLLLSVLGAVLVCGGLALSKHDPGESLTASAVRIAIQNEVSLPVSGWGIVPFLASLPGLLAFSLVLGWQLARWRRELPEA